MRIWGRVGGQWVMVDSPPDAVNLTWLLQVFRLNLGESPFWADWGIPQYQTILTQIFPDFYVTRTQSRFSGLFASLAVTKGQSPDPVYNVTVTLHNGQQVSIDVPA